MAAATNFFAALEARVAAVDSLLCVGLDPHSADLADATADGAYAFCARLIAATHASAAAFKPNSAFFEAFGAAGVAALARVCADVRATGALCLLDGKRGDIASTAEAYALGAYRELGADAVTINGYMGLDSVEPFARDAAKGVFVLCKTSNASAGELQSLPLQGGAQVYQALARLATGPTWNARSNIGLVVGATDTEALASVRALAPRVWVLAPGVGFQGGDLAAVLAAGLRADGQGLLLPVSRGISRAQDPAAEAERLRAAINQGRAAALAAAAAAAAPAAAAAAAAAAALPKHSSDFLQAALAAGVLKFGSFTLKSGRQSPYFFNAGNFRTGASIAALGRTYAGSIAACGVQFDVLFGPAYKGIPLVTVAAAALAEHHGLDYPFAYNRKEAKAHGEGGAMVGAELKGARVLIVDDVISAGTAIGESVELIRAAGGTPVAVVIGLDRQERGGGGGGGGASDLSAVQAVQATYGIPVTAVATLAGLVGFLEAAQAAGKDLVGLPAAQLGGMLASVQEYRRTWGV